MEKIKIGIPRCFLYYRNYVLWKTFFEGLGAEIIVSPPTNKDILLKGKNMAVDEACLPFKIYLGHIDYLTSKCDYILTYRICNYGRGKRTCLRFNGLYDSVHNLFPNVKLLNYNIDYLKFKFEFTEYIKMGFKINKNLFKIIYYYFLGKKREKEKKLLLENNQNKILKSNRLKILIVAHPYVIYDSFLGDNIVNYLKENDIDILYSDRFNRDKGVKYSNDFSNTLYFLYSKENIGSVFYYKDKIDGIIFLTSFPCGPDSLVNELAIRKLSSTSCINIILDESDSTSGLITRLESFIDIIKARRDNG